MNNFKGTNSKSKQSLVKSLRVQEKQSVYESIYQDVSSALQSSRAIGTTSSEAIVDALAAEARDVTREAMSPGAKPVSRLKRDREWGVELSREGMKQTEEQAMALAAKAAERAAAAAAAATEEKNGGSDSILAGNDAAASTRTVVSSSAAGAEAVSTTKRWPSRT